MVSYYKNATVPQEVADSWKQTRMQILEKTRQKIGGKLMLYNGFSISRDYDNDFLQYADGGLTEGFVHTSDNCHMRILMHQSGKQS